MSREDQAIARFANQGNPDRLERTPIMKLIKRAVEGASAPAMPSHRPDDANAASERMPLTVVDIRDFMAIELPQRERILAPWLMTQSLNMIHGWRGVGKTHVSLSIGYATACGGKFLNWKADKPHRVLIIDGEMPAAALQERLAAIIASNGIEPPEGFLQILTPDLQTGAMPDLATFDGQDAVNEAIEKIGVEVIIADNLSCLVRGPGRENDAESWNNVAEWALLQRQRGRSVIFIHHSGKNGAQRGTSKREDLLDVVLALRRQLITTRPAAPVSRSILKRRGTCPVMTLIRSKPS